jgi:FdhD protein
VEEPLEIRIAGAPLAVTMRTPGHDVELAAGFLVSEGIIAHGGEFAGAIHCGGPGQVARHNVLDVALAAGVRAPSPQTRAFYTTSSCGVCGKASIEAVETVSHYDVASDDVRVVVEDLVRLPDRLREQQDAFTQTGACMPPPSSTGRAASSSSRGGRRAPQRRRQGDRLGGAVGSSALRGTVLQVSGRASFELVQKAAMAGIPVLAAVSAPSSLAVELAERAGITLVGFLRGDTMNVYARADRLRSTQKTSTPRTSLPRRQ